MNKTNPVSISSKNTTEQKTQIHKQFLEKAIRNHNKTHELYGLFYLLIDYYDLSNYITASDYLIKAEDLVSKNSNPSWEAALCLKKALILHVKNDMPGKLQQYKKAFKKSSIAKDSIYMAESLEQISATYGEMEQYKKAEYYFKLAIPLLKKFDTKKQTALAYNNYSNLKSYENQTSAALININNAINIIHETDDTYIEMMYQINKAAVLTEMKQFEEAESLLISCEKTNLKNNWKDRLTHNYIGFADLYERWGKYEQSLDYYKKYYEEKELLNGIDIKLKIATLENENHKGKKEIELKNNQLSVIKYKREIDQLFLLIALVLLTLLATLLVWKKQKTKTKVEFEEKLSDLQKLTNLLISKNNTLLDQSKKTNLETIDASPKNDYNSILITKILTDSDWMAFKTYFEKVYPNYINRIRTTYPKITAAEERLFLCIKLNLNNKEVASILGISNESVKKSRNRLRKRIELSLQEKLNDYIRNF